MPSKSDKEPTPTPRFKAHQVPVTIEADSESVIMVVSAGDTALAMHLRSANQVLAFCNALIEEAAKLWPNNPYLKFYSSNDEGDMPK